MGTDSFPDRPSGLSTMTDETAHLERTPLYDLHLELGARMVPFAGYEMPVRFPLGIKGEHLHCRTQSGLFDVSHMGQVLVSGADAETALESLLPTDLHSLEVNHQRYTVFTNEGGGILDDLIVMRRSATSFLLVVNAACTAQDLQHLRDNLESNIQVEELSERALLALQGPAAAEAVRTICPDADNLAFMSGCACLYAGRELVVTRSGYTGEDGFEISCPNEVTERLARELLALDSVEPIGLGARDSLRLEAGLCLYGDDLDTQTTPVEAGLAWSISPSRRSGGDRQGGFPGADTVLRELKLGPSRKRVGLDIQGRAPVRKGTTIEDAGGNQIGQITSGGFGPSVGKPVAMGYVDAACAEPDTLVSTIVRTKSQGAKICTLPFVQPGYVRT